MNSVQLDRINSLQNSLNRAGVDYAVIPPSGDLEYLTGLHMHLSERLTLLVVPAQGQPTLVLPAFEASRVPPSLTAATWTEDQDPLPVLLELIGQDCRSLAFGERVSASYVLGVLEARPDARANALDQVTGGVRSVKTDEEIRCLRGAAQATDRAFAQLIATPFKGATESELADRLADALRSEGLTDVFASCAAGANAAFPHHHPGARKVEDGDGVLFDFGGRFGGYLSDVTRTVAVGHAPARLAEVHAAVAEAQQAALKVLRPGVRLGDVDAAARESLRAVGLADAFTHRLGHGLGLEIHEPPYLTGASDQLAQPGHVVTIEPGVYLDGELGVRIEDDVLITDNGYEVLTHAPRELLIVN